MIFLERTRSRPTVVGYGNQRAFEPRAQLVMRLAAPYFLKPLAAHLRARRPGCPDSTRQGTDNIFQRRGLLDAERSKSLKEPINGHALQIWYAHDFSGQNSREPLRTPRPVYSGTNIPSPSAQRHMLA